MQNPDRFTQGWQAEFGKFLRVRLTRRWLLPAAILILALEIGFTIQSLMVQAQDGGAGSGLQVSATFALQVINTFDFNLNNLCIGRTYRLPVRVALQTTQAIGGDLGNVRIRSATITPTTANASVVEVTPSTASSDGSPNAPFQTHITLTTRGVGSTTITISATVQSDVDLWLDEEVGMPIPTTSQTPSISVPVRVIPCRLQVRTASIWLTTIGAANVLMSATSNTLVEADVNGGFESPGATVRWFALWNRARGCQMTDSTIDEEQGVGMRGEIIGDNLRLTLTFQPLASHNILPIRCPGAFTWLDNDPGGHQEGNAIISDPTFTPESPTLDVRITGTRTGIPISSSVTQWLERRDGRVEGWLTVTVMPVPVGANP